MEYLTRRRLKAVSVAGFLFLSALTVWIISAPRTIQAPGSEERPGRKAPKNEPRLGFKEMHERLAARSDAAESRSRKAWKRDFPFKPTYHPTIRHDPAIYDANDPSTWSGSSDEHALRERMVNDHGFMRRFFSSPQRFTKEFQRVYETLQKYDRHENPMSVAKIFRHLKDYHKARQHDPNALWDRETYVLNDETGQFERKRVPFDDETTWGDQAAALREGIAANVRSPRNWPGKELMPAETAWEIADLLIAEIPAEDFLEMSDMDSFAYSQDHMEELKAGDPLLIPREGFVEDFQGWLEESAPQVAANIAQLLNEESERLPERLEVSDDGRLIDPETGEEFNPAFPVALRGGPIGDASPDEP